MYVYLKFKTLYFLKRFNFPKEIYYKKLRIMKIMKITQRFDLLIGIVSTFLLESLSKFICALPIIYAGTARFVDFKKREKLKN